MDRDYDKKLHRPYEAGRIEELQALGKGDCQLALENARGLMCIVTSFVRRRKMNLVRIACTGSDEHQVLSTPHHIDISEVPRMCSKCRKWARLFLQGALDEARAEYAERMQREREPDSTA